jgi:class 3 adenylate cyclase/tetratricopeptide (TPR) repeat protein
LIVGGVSIEGGMVCSNCGTENRPGRKFCSNCGQALAVTCWNCGAPNVPGDRFCGECGSALEGTPAAVGGQQVAQRSSTSMPLPGPQAERRLVSVLFADLVGFTPLSEQRDAEEVRDLLSRYFDGARRVIGRYGGTVEKFIGDAVMAVWGAPVAQEDDAERAVRAALNLADAVGALGADVGAPDLKARVGVLTGEAAVTLGAQAQGMVAGDLVNTASRIQSVAEPGTVLVGETTRRATEAAIDYDDAGSHDLKGKAEPVQLWRATRVVAGVRGALKASGLEAPFVGRDRELRLVKELFHAAADERKAQLATVVGIAGIGKSRLSWEFFKYIDGLADNVWWHRGRCLAYGEGVTYWALAEMVRMRARIDEGERPEAALAKLHDAVDTHVPDPEEQRWIEPRLAHLLGLEERTAADPKDLFSAWRLFFERLSDQSPTIMVFEDMQWADAALLDFIEYLLDWSRGHPLFVMSLARPELADRHPTWATGKRNFTSLYLEPLPESAMEELLTGLVPGLPADVRRKIQERAEGVPLYAVETVRMLLGRGLLVQEGSSYRPAGAIEELDVPETLHALIAARLDGLTQQERKVLQDASVVGKTFSLEALAAVSGMPAQDLEPLLTGLVRKEVVSFQTDPRSIERGQYAFLQDLLKRVAYETLSKKERKARHLAVAEFLETNWTADEDEMVEIVASHRLEAYRALPNADDAVDIRSKAQEALTRAGDRAASLAANGEAQRYYDQAYELADDDVQRAGLSERAGEMAYLAGRAEQGRERYERAADLFQRAGLPHPAARVSARLADLLWTGLSRLDDAVELMESSLEVLAEERPDETVATLMAQAGRLHFFRGELESAAHWIDRALEIAEELVIPEVLSQALNTKSLVIRALGHEEEATALLKHALDVGTEHGLEHATSRALNNLADTMLTRDRAEEAIDYDTRNLELSLRRGDRLGQLMSSIHLVVDHAILGQWDEAVAMASQFPTPEESPGEELWLVILHSATIPVLVWRGDVDRAAAWLAELNRLGETTELQDVYWRNASAAFVHQGQHRFEEALTAAEVAFDLRDRLGRLPSVGWAFVVALEAAFELGRFDRVEELLTVAESAPPRDRTPSIQATVDRFRGRLASLREDHDEADRRLSRAGGLFREIGYRHWLAVALLERAEVLLAAGRSDQASPLLTEAKGLFEQLGAKPYLERVDAAEGGLLERTAVS